MRPFFVLVFRSVQTERMFTVCKYVARMLEKVFLGSDDCFWIDLMQGIHLNKIVCNTVVF